MEIVIQYTEQTEGTITVIDTQQDVMIEHNAAVVVDEITIALPMYPAAGQKVILVSINGITTINMNADVEICSPRTGLTRLKYGSWCYSANSNKWLRIG